MRKLLFISGIALCSANAVYAQNVVKYCDLVVYRPAFKNYIAEMHIDGNKKTKTTVIKDTQGDKVKFASEADAVNYVTQQGWELVTAYHNHGGATHFFMRKG